MPNRKLNSEEETDNRRSGCPLAEFKESRHVTQKLTDLVISWHHIDSD